MSLISILEAGRRDFVDATLDVSREQAFTNPAPGSWSILECIEHVIAVEERYLLFISEGIEITPQRNPDKELRLFTMIRNRLEKREAPEIFRPRGRFAALPVALAEFQAIRDRSVQIVQERGESLYAIGAHHPYFGAVNGAELIHLIDGHARRHADQIRGD